MGAARPAQQTSSGVGQAVLHLTGLWASSAQLSVPELARDIFVSQGLWSFGAAQCCAPKQQALLCCPFLLSAALLRSAASAAELLSQPGDPTET